MARKGVFDRYPLSTTCVLNESGPLSLYILAHNGVTIVQGNASQSEEKQEKKSGARKTGLSIARGAARRRSAPSTHNNTRKSVLCSARACMQQARISRAVRAFYCFTTAGFMATAENGAMQLLMTPWRELLKCFGVWCVCVCVDVMNSQ